MTKEFTARVLRAGAVVIPQPVREVNGIEEGDIVTAEITSIKKAKKKNRTVTNMVETILLEATEK